MSRNSRPSLKSNDGSTIELEPSVLPLVIGRSPECQVTVTDHSVSRRHAQISQADGSYFLEDLGSRNGTQLNHERVSTRTRLHHGDRIQICDIGFVFQHEQSNASEYSSGPIVYEDSDVNLSSIMSRIEVQSATRGAGPDGDRKLEKLMQITRALNGSLRLDETLQNVMDYLFELFDKADRGVIVLTDANGDALPLATKVRESAQNSEIRVSNTILQYVMGNKQSVLSHDVLSDERIDTDRSLASVPIRSVMSVPLIDSEDQAIGMIQLDTTYRQQAFTQSDLELLTTVSIQSGMAIENSRMLEQLLKDQAVMQELEMARRVQESLLPVQYPDLPGYDFHHFYRPMIQIGGDYFDYLRLDDGRLAIIVGDVVGHGIPAALLMAKLSSECRMGLQTSDSLSTLAKLVNESFARLPPEKYATLIVTVLDPENHRLEVMNGGHLPPIRRRSDGSVEEINPVRNFAIGLYGDEEIKGGIEFQSYHIELQPGDSILLHTDGLNEAHNEAGEQYSRERVRQQFGCVNCTLPREAVNHLIADLGEYSGSASQDDDICLVCFQRTD